MKRLLQMRFIPTNLDLGLLPLRVPVAFTLFLNHGWEKASNYSELATRWACTINLFVALIFVQYFKLHGQGSGEVPWLYLWVVITLFIVGPGRYSIDGGPRGDSTTSNP